MAEKGEAEGDQRATAKDLERRSKQMMKQFKEIHRATTKLLTAAEEAQIKEAFTKDLPALTQTVSKQQKMIVESFEELSAFNKRLENLLQRQAADEERWARLDTQEEWMQRLVKDLETRQKEDEARWSKLDGKLSAMGKGDETITKLTGRLEVLGGQIAMFEATGDAVSQLTGRMDVLEKQLGDSAKTVEVLSEFRGKVDLLEKLSTSADALAQFRGKIDAIEKRLGETGRDEEFLSQLRGKMEMLETQLSGLSTSGDALAQIRAKSEMLEKQFASLSGAADSFAEMRARLDVVEKQGSRPAVPESLQATVNALDSRVKFLEEKELESKVKAIELQGFEARMKAMESHGSGSGAAAKDVRDVVERLALLEDRSSARDTDVAVLGEKVGKLEESAKRVEELRGTMQTTRESLSTLENRTAPVAEELRRLEESVAKFEGVQSELAGVADRVKEIEAIHARLDEITARVDEAARRGESTEELRRRLDAFSGAETALTQKVTEVESLTVPKIAAQVAAALERVEAMEKGIDSRIEDETARIREDVDARAGRVEKAMKDRDESAEELAGKVQQLELERDRIAALDEMVKKRLIPDPAIPKLQDELSRLNRRVDAVNEEGAATTKYIEEARGLANRAIERLARLEATPPGTVAKQEFAAQETKIAIMEEIVNKLRKDLESQKEKIMVVLEDLETMREVAAPAPRR